MIPQLILAIENDEQRTAVEYIYKELFKLMFQNAYNILNNYHDAQDAAYDALVRIIENAHKFENLPRNDTIALVVIYTRNAAKTFYRKRQKRYAMSLTTNYGDDESEDCQIDIPDESQDLDRIIVNMETVEILNTKLWLLDEEKRDVLILRDYFLHSYAEVSKVFGISEQTARARVCRARQKIKEMLGDEMHERIEF